jgi:hypothetical protein
MVRLICAATSVRILLSEQAYGSVGLLGVAGLINDQMVTLHIIVCLASIAGMVTALVTLNPANMVRPFIVASLLIAIGAWMDAGATNLTRPANFYISQALIGFAALHFIGPAMLTGMARVLLAGPRQFVSFVVLFNLSQSLGGLAGSAFLGTFQTMREKFHSHELVQSIVMTDPLVAAQIRAGGGAVSGVIGDPALRGAESAVLLAAQTAREANILAYNDVFLLIFVPACLALLWPISICLSMLPRGEPTPLLELMEQIKERQTLQQHGSVGV